MYCAGDVKNTENALHKRKEGKGDLSVSYGRTREAYRV